MRRLETGRVIVVGGHSRGVGKTALVVALVEALAPDRVATVKVSQHRHGTFAVVHDDRHAVPTASTGRCLLAGAERAFLCRCPDTELAAADQLVAAQAGAGLVTIVESNRMAARLQPTLTCFVVDGANDDWKASSWQVPHVDLVVTAAGPASPAPHVRAWLAARARGAATLSFDCQWRVQGLERWLSTALARGTPARAVA